jgi:hypothetical protein
VALTVDVPDKVVMMADMGMVVMLVVDAMMAVVTVVAMMTVMAMMASVLSGRQIG